MICQEAKDTLLRGLTVEILATDISEKVLAQAREGVYGSYTLRNLTPAQIKQHFIPLGQDLFQVKPEVKHLISFRHFNLVDYAGLPHPGRLRRDLLPERPHLLRRGGQGQGDQGVP